MSGIACARMPGNLRAADEADGLEDGAAHPGIAADRFGDDAADEVRGGAAVAGRRHAVGHGHEHVVVQVVADRQVGDHGDAVLAQMLRGADAGQHQELGRPVHPGAQDHLAAGRYRAASLFGDDLDPGGAALGDHHPGDEGPGDDRPGSAGRDGPGSRPTSCTAARRWRSAGRPPRLPGTRRCSRRSSSRPRSPAATNSMPLIEPEPPSTRPRGCGIRRPSAPACGAV